MKTTIIVFGCLALSVLAGFGQGTVNFNNTATTFADSATVDRFVYTDFVGGTKLVGQNWAAALYWGTSSPDASITQLAVLNATDTSLASALGRFRVPTTASPGTWSGGSRTLLGTVPGQQVFMQIRIWDVSLYESYAVAYVSGGITGRSGVFSYTISTSPTPPPSDLVMINLRGPIIVPIVPEPSVLALSLVGLGALLFVGRRR